MRSQIPFFLLTSLLASSAAVSDSLPKWITSGALEDASYRYIVCSQDGLDPEDIRQAAEAKCLSSAAKLNGVNITVKEKSVQSLTGVDASEVAEIEPKNKETSCTWTDRYLEKLASGYRIWLRCKVPKTRISPAPTKTLLENAPAKKQSIPPYKRATLTITSVPAAEKILVEGSSGERVFDPKGNVFQLELKEGDRAFVLKRQKYKDAKKELAPWKHGESLHETIYFDREL